MPPTLASSPTRKGPNGDDFAALGGQGISVVTYSQNQEEAIKFLEWFIKDETQKRWAELGGYTCHAAVLEVGRVPQRHAVQRSLLPDHVQGEGLLGAAGVCRAADRSQPTRSTPTSVNGEGTAQETLDKLAATWVETPQGRRLRGRVSRLTMSPGRRSASPGFFELGGPCLD